MTRPRAQVKLLSELRHQCIVSYRESFIESDTLYIVMHYCEGGDLTSLIKKRSGEFFTEEVRRHAQKTGAGGMHRIYKMQDEGMISDAIVHVV